MLQYGKKKNRTAVSGHQRCVICHPPQESTKSRARREGKRTVEEFIREIEIEALFDSYDVRRGRTDCI